MMIPVEIAAVLLAGVGWIIVQGFMQSARLARMEVQLLQNADCCAGALAEQERHKVALIRAGAL